jgi:hypothetical protein
METKTLPSGAILEMTMAPFEDGHKLLKAVSREIESTKITTGMQDLEAIKNLMMRAIYSEEIERALIPCLARCKYNKQLVNTKLFSDETITDEEKIRRRGDYLPVVKEVLMYNLTPFFISLGSLFKDIQTQLPVVRA